MMVGGSVTKTRAFALFDKLDMGLKDYTFEKRFVVQSYKVLNITNSYDKHFIYP